MTTRAHHNSSHKSGHAGEGVMDGFESIKDDFQKLRDDITRMGGMSAQALRSKALEGAEASGKVVKDFTSKRPVTALLVAAGVGALAAAWFFRK